MTDTIDSPPRAPEPHSPSQTNNSFQVIVKRFWGFDHMIGGVLIKVIYYVGLVGIALTTLMAMAGGGGLVGDMLGAGGGVLAIILALIGGLIYLVFWRFICELWLLMFLMYNRMGEIRDRLPL